MSDLAVVTGGAGFVGKALVAYLRDNGWRVSSFDLANPSHEDDVQGSILNDAELASAFTGAKVVFHLAGDAQLWARDTGRFDLINHRGTQNVIEAAKKAGVARLVHCSSLTTLVGRSTPIGLSNADELVRLEPDDMLGAYPKSKLLAEHCVEEAVRDGLDTVIAIPTEPLGAGDISITPPSRMIIDFVNGKTPAYIDCILNFVPVQSLAAGFMAAYERGEQGARYLLGGENVAMSDLLTRLQTTTGRKMPTMKMPYGVALMAGLVDTKIVSNITKRSPKAPLTGVRLAGRQVSFSSERAARDLGWRAGPFEIALKEALEWFDHAGLIED